MADYRATSTEFTAVADAIRTKGGTSAQLTWPNGFVSAVQAIPTGGSAVVEPLSVTENGTYNPPSGVDGYAPVSVNVSGGGGVPAGYTALTREAIVSIGSRTYNNQGYYYSSPYVNETSGVSHYLFPTGSVSCSAEVYFDADNTGFLLGFGNKSARQMFSFAPDQFVGFYEEHSFSESYTGKHHFVVTYNGDTTVKLYVDGILSETIQLSSNLDIGTNYFFQGRWANTSNELLTGDIYFTRIWSRELTAAEALILYQNKDV